MKTIGVCLIALSLALTACVSMQSHLSTYVLIQSGKDELVSTSGTLTSGLPWISGDNRMHSIAARTVDGASTASTDGVNGKTTLGNVSSGALGLAAGWFAH